MYKELRHFIAIVEKGNLSSAAKTLGITQSALSKSLRRLEENLGLQLLERGARGVRLTSSGQKILSHAQNVDAELRYLEFEADAERTEAAKLVKIGVSPTWGSACVPNIVQQFYARFPEAVLQIKVDIEDGLMSQLEDGSIDFAICRTSVPNSDHRIDFDVLVKANILTACRAGHPILESAGGNPEELFKCDWINYRSALDRSSLRDSSLRDRISGKIVETDSWVVGLQIASKSDFLMTLTDKLAPFIEKFGLVYLSNYPPIAEYQFGVWYRKSARESKVGKSIYSIAKSAMVQSMPENQLITQDGI